jgi:aspartate/methionine/tyrosine aminotransferase
VRLSKRAVRIGPFIVMEVLERALELEARGREIIHLEVGEPDFETPAVIREAGIRAIRDGHTHYTHSLGRWELREAIASRYAQLYGVDISPERVVVTVGSSGAMLLVFAALLDPGDEVLVPDPGYPCYPKFVQAFDGVPLGVRVEEKQNFEFDPGRLSGKITERTRALILNSPSNPTGTLAAEENLGRLTELAEGRLSIVSDEIYHGLTYEGRATSMLEVSSECIIIGGFSKLFAMTGWRLGFAVVPQGMVRTLQKLQQNLFISAPDFSQLAALSALTDAGQDIERMRLEYDRRRRFLIDRARRAGLRVAGHPVGAFYLLLNVSPFTENVYELAFEILEKAGVAVTPGIDFGRGGEGYIRLCYATSMEKLELGMDRLEEFFNSRRRI